MSSPTHCPKCNADFQGDPIPEKDQHLFNRLDGKPIDPGWKTHFSRLIGIYDFHRDMTVSWGCPDCGHEWGMNGDRP